MAARSFRKRRKAPSPSKPTPAPTDTAPSQPAIPKNLFPVQKHAGGRPCEFTQYISDIICARLMEGESLRSVCRSEGMPSGVTVFRWLRVYPEFLGQYTRAINNRVETHVEEMIDIADDSRNDTQVDEDGNVIVNHDHIQRSRLRVDTRKWIASKLKPRKYGERQVTEHTGAHGGPLVVETKNALVDRLMALLLERAGEPPKVIENAAKKA